MKESCSPRYYDDVVDDKCFSDIVSLFRLYFDRVVMWEGANCDNMVELRVTLLDVSRHVFGDCKND